MERPGVETLYIVYGVSIYIYTHKIKQLVYEAYTEA